MFGEGEVEDTVIIEEVKPGSIAVRQRFSLLKAVITAFPCVSLRSAFLCGSTALTEDRCNQAKFPELVAGLLVTHVRGHPTAGLDFDGIIDHITNPARPLVMRFIAE
eukprot:SAG22_NODE_382_length_11344_cov_41.312228_6_plen_107_part_00